MAAKKKAVASKKTQGSKKPAAKASKAPAKKATAKASTAVAKKTAPVAKKGKTVAPPAKAAPAARPTRQPEPAATARASVKPASKPAMRPARSKDTDTVLVDITPYDIKTGEDYMNDAQVKHFRNILKSWKRDLMEEVDRTVHHMQDEAANFPDPNDRATQESEFTMELRARDRERKLIRKIEESLSKLDSGDYGYCEQCGVEIGVRRLEARPTATLCIDCKTLAEIKERHISS